MNVKEMLKNYFKAECDSMASLYQQACSTGHSIDTGSNREKLLINFLNKHLPNKFQAIKGGKIFDSNEVITKQVDVIVYDNEVPRLASQENTLYLAEGVSSAIEVKSSLNIDKFQKSLENLKSIKLIQKRMNMVISSGNIKDDIYCGVFSYDTQLTVDKILEELKKFSEKNDNNDFADFVLVNKKFLFVKNNGTWYKRRSDEKKEKIEEKYLIFEDDMILYRLFILFCSEISQIKLGTINYNNYVNMKF